MDEAKIDIYLSQDDIENIIFNDDKYPHLFQILKKYARLYVNLESKELESYLEEMTELVGNLLNDMPIFSDTIFFKEINNNRSVVVSKTRAMYFLDISPEEAYSLSNKFGVIIQSSNRINDDALQLSFYKYIEKGRKYNSKSDGWLHSLDELSLPPFNSLVITDDYLLANTKQDKNIGFENLKMMLNAILPKDLETSFHLLVITPMEKISTKKADRLNGELKAYLRTIRPYDINLEFVFRDTIHPRKAFANYFVMVCDKGFKMFDPIDKVTGHEDENDIRFTSILHDAATMKGDTMLMVSKMELTKLKDLCDKLSIQIINGVSDHTKKIIGDTNKDKTIRNRLMN